MIHVNENYITEHRSSAAVSTTKHIGHQLVAAVSKQARVLHSICMPSINCRSRQKP